MGKTKTVGVYMIVNKTNGKFYIGSSVDCELRFWTHTFRLNKGVHSNPHLQNAWSTYGANSFLFLIIDKCHASKSELLAVEQKWLNLANIGGNKRCYNCLAIAGSHLGAKRSEESKKRLSAALCGRTVTAEARAKMRAAKLGKPLSDEHKAKIGAKSKGRPGPVHTEENLRKWRSITPDKVDQIFAMYADGFTKSHVARTLGVRRHIVRSVLAGKAYKEGVIPVQVVLPFPPSMNGYWPNVGGRVYVSEKGSRFRAKVIAELGAMRLAGRVSPRPMTGRIGVYIEAHPPEKPKRRRDLDNYLKPLLDALMHAKVFVDDEQIDDERIVRKAPCPDGKVVVTIWELSDQTLPLF